ncbi:CYTH domain-containing protein [Alkalibacillus silvisoli]|uniref:CYTH domain-containing protein n=1 Tax=Alkalibacillus silvisoli TaxID=392823 RepID=A0ABP3JIV5_9BACI
MQEIEIEFKNLLTKEEYDALVEHYINDYTIAKNQTNYYFETADFQLKHKHAALRVREKGGHYIATLKQPVEDGLLETHDSISETQFNEWYKNLIDLPPNIKKQLDEIGINGNELEYKGTLQTIRYEQQYDNCLIVLDHSTYNGREDYELELEVSNYEQGKQLFEKILNRFKIKQRATSNKIARFLGTVKN